MANKQSWLWSFLLFLSLAPSAAAQAPPDWHKVSGPPETDVVLYGIVEDMPQGKTLDIVEASRIDGFDISLKGTNDYKDIDGSDIVIVTAGLPRQPGMSRDDLIVTNAKIMQTVAENVKKHAPNSIAIIISNPLDAMVTLYKKIT